MQMVKMVPRGFTATADAYLTPHIMRSICIPHDASLFGIKISYAVPIYLHPRAPQLGQAADALSKGRD